MSGSALPEEVEVVQDEICATGKSFLSKPVVPSFSLSEELEAEAGFALVVVAWWDELEALCVLVDEGVEATSVLPGCVEDEATAVLVSAAVLVASADDTAAADETEAALQRPLRRRWVGAAKAEAREKARMISRVLKAYMVA